MLIRQWISCFHSDVSLCFPIFSVWKTTFSVSCHKLLAEVLVWIKRFSAEVAQNLETANITFLADILMQFSRGKSALVFCSTRKGAQEAAQKISQTAMKFGHSNPFIKTKEQQERLREASLSCSDRQMQSYILYGGLAFFLLPSKLIRKCSSLMYMLL